MSATSDSRENLETAAPPQAPALVAGLNQRLDEAIRDLELRRYRRIITAGRLPFVYSAGVLLLSWFLVPLFFGQGGIMAGTEPISGHPGWAAGVLLTVSGMGAALGAYFRSQHLWNEERSKKTFHTWLLSRQVPAQAALTTIAMATLMGLILVAVPAGLGLLFALGAWLHWWQVLLSALLLVLCSLAGAAVGAAAFFISFNLVPGRLYYPGLLLLLLLFAGVWLRIEAVEGAYNSGWERHSGRVSAALNLMTPVPAMFGLSAPAWWERAVAPRLGVQVGPWAPALVYALFLLLLAGYSALLARSGYLRLAADPDRLEEKPRRAVEEVGQEYYWKGFKNPVWTRDIRTRLRSRDTAEFIFFASVAVAAGGFVPLIMTASDLSDPLQTAKAARQVFFWLTMTLVALVTLITPGLTADVITQERAQGTLEMLVGTALRPREILIGKLLGAICVTILLISPSLPLFGLCYLFHGASGLQVVQVYVLLLVTLAISALIGLTQSAINAKAGMAKFWSYAVIALFVSVPGGPFWIAAAIAAPQAEMRQALSNQGHVTAVVAVFWGFIVLLFWGNASEQLEYSEY